MVLDEECQREPSVCSSINSTTNRKPPHVYIIPQGHLDGDGSLLSSEVDIHVEDSPSILRYTSQKQELDPADAAYESHVFKRLERPASSSPLPPRQGFNFAPMQQRSLNVRRAVPAQILRFQPPAQQGYQKQDGADGEESIRGITNEKQTYGLVAEMTRTPTELES